MRFSPTQECQGNNVFNLGDGIGDMRIETESVDFSTAPRYEEGVHLRQRIHKTGNRGEAVVLLSLPDLILMDSYQATAQHYCDKHKIEYP